MKRRKIKTLVVAAILALSLSTGGLASGTWIPPSDGMNNSAPDAGSTQTGLTQTNDEIDLMIPPVFTIHPQSQGVLIGQNVIFTAAVTGTPVPALQWQVSINGGITWTDIEGQTALTLRLSSVNLTQNNTMYRIIATTSDTTNGTTTSEVVSGIANLTVNTLENAHIPLITTQPADNSVLVNGNVTLSVTANVTDRGTLSYQWFSNNADRNTGGTLIRGATSRTFTPPTNVAGTVYYYVVITNTNNYVSGNRVASVTSTTARVASNALIHAQTPEITEQPGSETVLLDGRTVLSAAARVRDNGTLSFQWFRNETNSNTGGTPVHGATGSVFAPETDSLGVSFYYVVITNTNNNVNGTRTAAVTSQAVSVAVITTPGAPQNLEYFTDGNRVVLSWEAPASNGGSEILGYQISDNIVTIWIDANGVYEHVFEGLFYSREYTLMVRAVNAAGSGEAANLIATTADREEINVDGVSLDRERLELYVGEYTRLFASFTPGNAEDRSVTWSTDNSLVAIVDENGTVTALSPGTATITVTTNDGAHTASSTVTVVSPESANLFFWIGLGILAPVGTGTGIYLWKRKR